MIVKTKSQHDPSSTKTQNKKRKRKRATLPFPPHTYTFCLYVSVRVFLFLFNHSLVTHPVYAFSRIPKHQAMTVLFVCTCIRIYARIRNPKNHMNVLIGRERQTHTQRERATSLPFKKNNLVHSSNGRESLTQSAICLQYSERAPFLFCFMQNTRERERLYYKKKDVCSGGGGRSPKKQVRVDFIFYF